MGGWNPEYERPRDLVQEAYKELLENGKSPADVQWCGTHRGTESGRWDDFVIVSQGVDMADAEEWLVIVGQNWWLEIYEYDSQKSWVFKALPIWGKGGPPAPLTRQIITRV